MTATELSNPASELPRPLTRFIGRNDEIETLVSLLNRDDVRLVTLTGPGGVGKTRLSIEVAHRMNQDAGREVRFVTLATISDAEDATIRIARALGLWSHQAPDAISRLADLLRSEDIVLVIDNVEHVVDIAGDVANLLAATDRLTILATSRTPLHIQGEREYSVPQLSTPRSPDTAEIEAITETESFRLFVDRVQSVDHRFQVDEQSIPIIASICERLDGLPLAIELAAARARALPPAALLARLENQLELLHTSARDVPQRLRTIRATIDWSYQLLDVEEQDALSRLAVFSGDFPLSAAMHLLNSDESLTLDILESLIDQSLLLPREPLRDEPHYRMLTVVGQFGLEQLDVRGELDNVRLAEAQWAATFCESLFHEQLAANQHEVFRRIGRVHDSIRQAILWTMEQQHWLLSARIAGNLWQYWDISGHLQQGRSWLRQIIQQDIDWPHTLIPRLFYGFAILAGSESDAHENERVGNWLLERYGHLPDIRLRATAMNVLGLCRNAQLAFESSVKAMELWEQAGEQVWHGLAAGLAGRWARELGDIDASEHYSRRSWEVLTNTGHRWGASLALQGVARVQHLRGEIDRADVSYRQGLEELAMLGDRILVLRFFEFLIEIAAQRGNWERAIRLSGAASRMRSLMGYELRYTQEAAASSKLHQAARDELGDERFSELLLAGSMMSLEESIQLALAGEVVKPGSRPEDTSHPESPLTRRESEVLALIVAGKTDQAIADELFVSYRTVTTHVSHILNKLGADTRTEAATIAVRQGLVG